MSTDSLKVWHCRRWHSALMEEKTKPNNETNDSVRWRKTWRSNSWRSDLGQKNLRLARSVGWTVGGMFLSLCSYFSRCIKAIWDQTGHKNPVCSNVATIYFSKAATGSLFVGFVGWKWEGLPAHQPSSSQRPSHTRCVKNKMKMWNVLQSLHNTNLGRKAKEKKL